jgi:SAM-dependent methyltransferase
LFLRKLGCNGRLLDVGCGKGFFLEIARKYFDTYGVDISKFAVGRAKHTDRLSKLCIGSATNLSFADGHFDVIVCFDVLEHIRNPQIVLKECHRTLKEGGLLITCVPNMTSLGRILKKKNWFAYSDPTHISLLPPKKWLEMLKEENFNTTHLLYDGLWDSPYANKFPALIQHLFFKLPSNLLFSAGMPFPKRLGENMYTVSKKVSFAMHSTNAKFSPKK